MRERQRFGVTILGLAALALLLGEALGCPARAGIISTSGQVQIVPLPPSLVNGTFASNAVASIMHEGGPFALPHGGVMVNIDAPGGYDSNASLTGGKIPAGTRVDSYLLHSDTVKGTHTYSGSITFDQDVLGLIVKSDLLTDTDPILGDPLQTIYPATAGRGLELGNPTDSVTLSADRRTVTFDFKTGGELDEVRIVTAAPAAPPPAVPEPSTLALLSLGGLALAGWRRWKRKGARTTTTA